MTNPSNRGPTTAVCLHCQQTFNYRIYGEGRGKHYNRNQKFCSRECYSESRIKGWGTDKSGYKFYYRAVNKKRVYVFEHRKVMEEFLERPLRREETVHHKNGNRSDNRIENLELWSTRHGKGQRVSDNAPFFNQSQAVQGIAGLV